MNKYRVRVGMGQDRPMAVIRFLLIAAVGVCGALYYVYQHTQLVQVGYNLRQAEKYLDECVKKNTNLEMKIAKMKSPEYLEQLVVKYELKLMKPEAEQIVRVNERQKNRLSSSQKSPTGTVN